MNNHSRELKNETINYNERFHWTWDQGRFGFGPYAGLLQREFREAQYRGAPLPILWIVDYFVIDGEGFRYGRFYRTAGWYTHIVVWSAFPCWLVANILFRSIIRYGGYMLGIAGCHLLMGNLLWLVIRNPDPLVIPFQDDSIYTKFGPTYWLIFSCGVICICLSIAILVCEYFYSNQLHVFFGIDPINSLDEKYVAKDKIEDAEAAEPINDGLPMAELRHGKRVVTNNRRKTLLIHVRKNTKSVVKRRNEEDYVNVADLRQEVPITEIEEPEYANNETVAIPSKQRLLPPLPPKRR